VAVLQLQELSGQEVFAGVVAGGKDQLGQTAIERRKVLDMLFKRFLVSTVNSNEFIVRVADLEGIYKSSMIVDQYPTELQLWRQTLERALFIEQAIQEKMDSVSK